MSQPNILSSEIVYRGFFNVRLDHLKLPHGPEIHFNILILKGDAAVILAETEDKKFLVLNEYRHATGQWLIGCPGGMMDPGETPLQTAKRELNEETGFDSQDLTIMGSIYPFPAICNQKIHFILAKNAKFVKPATLETFEFIQPLLKTKEEIFQAITSGIPVDGILCTALLLRGLMQP